MQVEHKTEKGTVLFVKAPDDAFDFELSFWNYQAQSYTDYQTLIFKSQSIDNLKNGDRPHILLHVEGYDLIGITSEFTEEKSVKIVDKSLLNGLFINYLNKGKCFYLALESFKSLMQHLQVYEVNPIGHPDSFTVQPSSSGWRPNQLSKWQEAESRTGRWVVLFKPNEK